MAQKLVIFGLSNILSDLFDCALANRLCIGKIVPHHAQPSNDRDVPLADRLAALAASGETPTVQALDQFIPETDELYLLGPTTPIRAVLAAELRRRFEITFTILVHPTAYVSGLAALGQGVFIGANSVVAAGARLDEHVFVNRGVTVGHDTHVGAFSRLQPGSNIGGLSRLGPGVTIGIGATLVERLVVGANAFVGAGAVVTKDVSADVMVFGNPARFSRSLVART